MHIPNALILFDSSMLAPSDALAPLTAAESDELRRALMLDGLRRFIETADPDTGVIAAVADSAAAEAVRSALPLLAVDIPVGDTLAARMADAVDDAFNEGYRHIVVLSSDACTVPQHTITAAFTVLDMYEDALVLGPSSTCLYAIGMRRPHPEIFSTIDSMCIDFDEAVSRVREEDTALYLLARWHILRSIDDLRGFMGDLPAFREMLPSTAATLDTLLQRHDVLRVAEEQLSP